MSAEAVTIPQNCEVIFYNAVGTAMANNYAEKVFERFQNIGTKEAMQQVWNSEFLENVYYTQRVGKVPLLTTAPKVGDLPIIEKNNTINTVLIGSGSLPHSGIYKEGARIRELKRGIEVTLKEVIADVTNRKELEGEMLRVHWLACLSDHIEQELGKEKLGGYGYKACIK